MAGEFIHQIWLGTKDMPGWFSAYQQSWLKFFPDRKYRLWTDGNLAELLPDMVSTVAFQRSLNVGLRSDILRLELLRQHGGIYADIDFECVRPFGDLLPEDCFIYGDEGPYRPGNAIMAARKGHPFLTFYLECIARYLESCDLTKPLKHSVQQVTGPDALHRALQSWVWKWDTTYPLHDLQGNRLGVRYRDVVVMDIPVFYPYGYKDPQDRVRWQEAADAGTTLDHYPLTYAAHHWGGTWQ
jgi:mannosyltransferase OCH1-like enzyme